MRYLPSDVIPYIFNNFKEFIVFETMKFDKKNFHSYIFVDPVETIKLYDIRNVGSVFGKIEKFICDKQYYIAGFFSYEFGYGLDFVSKNGVDNKYNFPLVYLNVFKDPIIYNHKTGRFSPHLCINTGFRSAGSDYKITNVCFNNTEKEYNKSIAKIKKYISNGDTYQVNYTMKCKFNFNGSVIGLYNNLKKMQKVSYSAFMKTTDFTLLSFSPELFFSKTGNAIVVKPMKGTISRGADSNRDKKQSCKLFNSIKDRSENVMIVDLLRNDLGRISQIGHVNVKKLFEIEKYKTLFQMTSTIVSKLSRRITFYDLFNAIFPSGSVTGAPKIRTMQIIRELEKEPRGVYTGAIGFFTPHRNAMFNIAIRTAVIKDKKGELGIGSGIVWDSGAKKEFEECKLKALFLLTCFKQFMLIETMLWSGKQGYVLLKYHLNRLKKSAGYFGFAYDEGEIKKKLNLLKKDFSIHGEYKVRLLLSVDGKIFISFKKIEKTSKRKFLKIALSKLRIDSENKFLYHKTTLRKIYDVEYKKHCKSGYFDVLFRNNLGEITEASRGNIFIKTNGKYITPPVKCGLLPGVFRQNFIEINRENVEEKVITINDVKNADKIFFTNSVVGMKEVKIVTMDYSDEKKMTAVKKT
ncbi:MAG: aminodeoxychorismate synthase component I [Elusimicrobia bacterium]|nr:aminodeoxychorismate synthase component I [Elusimicrobiota bacterium]